MAQTWCVSGYGAWRGSGTGGVSVAGGAGGGGECGDATAPAEVKRSSRVSGAGVGPVSSAAASLSYNFPHQSSPWAG